MELIFGSKKLFSCFSTSPTALWWPFLTLPSSLWPSPLSFVDDGRSLVPLFSNLGLPPASSPLLYFLLCMPFLPDFFGSSAVIDLFGGTGDFESLFGQALPSGDLCLLGFSLPFLAGESDRDDWNGLESAVCSAPFSPLPPNLFLLYCYDKFKFWALLVYEVACFLFCLAEFVKLVFWFSFPGFWIFLSINLSKDYRNLLTLPI